MIDVHFLFSVEELCCELNYHDQKIRWTFSHDILAQQSVVVGSISSGRDHADET